MAASWQAGLWLIAKSLFLTYPASLEAEEVCLRAGVGRSPAYAAAQEILRRLRMRPPTPPRGPDLVASSERERDFVVEVLVYERAHPGSIVPGESRDQFDDEYKGFIEATRAKYGIRLSRVSELLHISLDTLKKFSRTARMEEQEASQPDAAPLSEEARELIGEYLRAGSGAKTVKGFCDRHPELLNRLGMSYRDVLGQLKRLGFASPRGIFLKNTGLDRIIRFKPNQLWHGDGKIVDVVINGECFRWVWQALADGKTTVIVGGAIGEQETTQSLLDGIQDAEAKTGATPMAIVLDNRLSENLPAIRAYLNSRGIEIVNTFPGNAKSNSIIEENFNVFDRWVGRVVIEGSTPKQLARSIQEAMIEVFTQQRGRKPRKGLSGKSLMEVMDEEAKATPEQEALAREKIKALADRLKNEQAEPSVSEQKKAAIAQAVERTNPPHRDVFEKTLSNPRYSADLILQALAILEKCRKEQPHKQLGHAYFGGILRRLADQQGIEFLNTSLQAVYAQHWETMSRLKEKDLAGSLSVRPEESCTRLATDFMNMPAPAYATAILLDMKQAFLVATRASAELAEKLRQRIASHVLNCKRASAERREALLRHLYAWENFVRMAGPDGAPIIATAPAGHA